MGYPVSASKQSPQTSSGVLVRVSNVPSVELDFKGLQYDGDETRRTFISCRAPGLDSGAPPSAPLRTAAAVSRDLLMFP